MSTVHLSLEGPALAPILGWREAPRRCDGLCPHSSDPMPSSWSTCGHVCGHVCGYVWSCVDTCVGTCVGTCGHVWTEADSWLTHWNLGLLGENRALWPPGHSVCTGHFERPGDVEWQELCPRPLRGAPRPQALGLPLLQPGASTKPGPGPLPSLQASPARPGPLPLS